MCRRRQRRRQTHSLCQCPSHGPSVAPTPASPSACSAVWCCCDGRSRLPSRQAPLPPPTGPLRFLHPPSSASDRAQTAPRQSLGAGSLAQPAVINNNGTRQQQRRGGRRFGDKAGAIASSAAKTAAAAAAAAISRAARKRRRRSHHEIRRARTRCGRRQPWRGGAARHATGLRTALQLHRSSLQRRYRAPSEGRHMNTQINSRSEVQPCIICRPIHVSVISVRSILIKDALFNKVMVIFCAASYKPARVPQ